MAFVDFIRIEGSAVAAVVPLGEVLVFGMFRVGDGFEEGLEARRAAAVFRRSASVAFDVARIFGAGLAIPDFFDSVDRRAKGTPLAG